VIGASASILVFFVLLLSATQLMLGLHATSIVTAVAHDAARRASARGASLDHASMARYEAAARSQLGALGRPGTARFDWRLDDIDGDLAPDALELTVTVADPPAVLPATFGGLLGFDPIRETVRVRIEQLTPP
jgi:hypothetical protein